MSRDYTKYDGIAELHATMSVRQLMEHYQTTERNILTKLRKIGIKAESAAMEDREKTRKREYEKYKALAETMTASEIAAHLEDEVNCVRKRLHRLGIKAQPYVRVSAPKPVKEAVPVKRTFRSNWSAQTPSINTKPMREVDLAQAFLQRECAVSRCTEEGKSSLDGKFFRRGNAVLSADKLVELAMRKGWTSQEMEIVR